METPDALLDTEDLAQMLKVPATTIQTWRSRKKGPPVVRVGRYVRYRREDVERWLESQMAGAA